MDTVKFVPMLVGLLLAVVMVGAVFVPVISSSTTRTVTTEIENEGAGWLALGYNEGTDYSFTVGYDEGDNFTVGTQTGEYANMICYADPQRTLFVSGDNWYLLTNGETPSVHKFTENASVTNASGTLTITDGSETVYTGASPNWAYVPDANGVYGFFTEGGLNLEEGKPKVAVGSYAGAFAYNDTVVALGDIPLDMVMSGDYAESDVIWEHTAPANTQNSPTMLRANLNPSGSKTDDSRLWTFEVFSDNARLYTYLGTDSTNIIAPSQVVSGGVTYNVNMIGNATSRLNVLTNDNLSADGCTLKIEEGIEYINGYICNGATNLKGTLVLPESLLGFYGTGAFNNCGFDSLIVKGNTEFTGATYFTNSSIKEVLNLGTTEITTTSYGLNADSVQDHISALGYIAPTLISETEVITIDSPVAGLMQLLPLIAGIGALFLAVGTMIYTRF